MDDDEDYFVSSQIGAVQQLTERPVDDPPPRRPIGFVHFSDSRPTAKKKPQRRRARRK